MKIAICDDSKVDIKALYTMLHDWFSSHDSDVHVEVYDSGQKLLLSYEQQKLKNRPDWDIVFLDIYMADMNGIDTARKLREKAPNTMIIFVTSSEEHAIESYDLMAEGYLVKPGARPRLYQLLERLDGRMDLQYATLNVTSDRIPVSLPIAKIRYIEVFNWMCMVHTVGKDFQVNVPLKDIEEQLSQHPNFIKCNRCYLVNLDYAKSVDDNAIVMDQGEEISISVRNKQKTKQAYINYYAQQKGADRT